MQEAASNDPRTTLKAMVERRARGEPLQYILGQTVCHLMARLRLIWARLTGSQPFGPLNLLVRPPVLIPRPETEEWAIRLSERMCPTPHRPVKVLDLCTGSGCIPLLLCHQWPPGSVRAFGFDISRDAVRLAKDNATQCGFASEESTSLLQNTFHVSLGNILDPAFAHSLTPPYDVLTSNPPYIPRLEYDRLPSCVKDYEDIRALLGDIPGDKEQDGLAFYRGIARIVAQEGLLAAGGLIALEVGHGQARSVEAIMQREGRMPHTEVWLDPWQQERVVFARK